MTCLQNPASKNTKKSKLNESLSKVKQLTEEDEMDLSYDDIEEPEEVMDDVQDDIVVVVDPELDADEVEDAAAEAQEIVDGTPEGEVPTTDEYVGDKTYTCPICGNTFFSEVEMNEGDTCPVCGETPSAFVLVGEVADPEEAPAEDVPEGEEVPAEEPAEEEIPEEVPAEDEELEEESVKCPKCGKDPCECKKEKCESEELECIDRKPMASKPRFQIDDESFNPYLNKFIRENYKNARSFKMTGATLNKNRTLTLECVITFKSGNTKNVKLKTEGFRAFNGKRAYIDFKEDGAFKTEAKAKVAPFIFTTSMNRNILKCEGLKYNFVSKVSEGKSAHIYGKVMFESRRPVRK